VILSKEGSSERDGIQMSAYDFEPEPGIRLRLHLAHRAGLRAQDLELVALNVLDAEGWQDFCATYHSRFGKYIETVPAVKPDEQAFESEKKMFESFKWGMVYLSPRGVGATEWTGSEKAQTQRLRRFYLLGQTVDSMRTWDIRRGVQAVKQIAGLEKMPLWIQAQREMAANALYASLFEDGITRLDLHDLPTTHRQGPAYLNVLKYLDLPQAAAMAAEKTRVILYTADEKAWAYPTSIVKLLGLPEKQWQIRKPVAAE
jgi:hypothetical protein